MVKEKQNYIAMIENSRDLSIVEQVFVIVWLAQTYTLKELRQRQCLIAQQIMACSERNLPNATYQNLDMMQENHAAAVAYQTFDDDGWTAFLKFPGIYTS